MARISTRGLRVKRVNEPLNKPHCREDVKILAASNSRKIWEKIIASTKSHRFPNRTYCFKVFEVAVSLFFQNEPKQFNNCQDFNHPTELLQWLFGFFRILGWVLARSRNCQPIYPLNYSKILNPPKQTRAEDLISTPKKGDK